MDIYSFIKIYQVTKGFYERVAEIMKDLSGYGEKTIEELSEFFLILAKTLTFIEDLLDSMNGETETITDKVILNEFHILISSASTLEAKLENFIPIYVN